MAQGRNRTLSLLSHLPRLERDGVTHRRDCECVRCDAGFRPSEQERASAKLRFEVAGARAAAERALARRRERLRVKQVALVMELRDEVRATDDQVQALRDARARADGDERLAHLVRLRRAGLPLPEALAEVERLREVK